MTSLEIAEASLVWFKHRHTHSFSGCTPRDVTQSDLEVYLQLVKNGATLKDVALHTGLSVLQIRRALYTVDHNLQHDQLLDLITNIKSIRSSYRQFLSNRPRPVTKFATSRRWEMYMAYVNSDLSVTDVAKVLGVSNDVLREALKHVARALFKQEYKLMARGRRAFNEKHGYDLIECALFSTDLYFKLISNNINYISDLNKVTDLEQLLVKGSFYPLEVSEYFFNDRYELGRRLGWYPPDSEDQSDKLELLGLSTREYNALARRGVQTISDLRGTSKEDLLKIRNLGELSVDHILSKLALFSE